MLHHANSGCNSFYPLKPVSKIAPTHPENHHALARRRNRPPQRHSLGAGGLGIPKQRLELMGVQPEGGWFRIGRPPRKFSDREPFLTQPKTLPVKYEALQRLAPSTRKNHQGTRHRVDFEMLPAHLRQAVYSFPVIPRSE
jgi:hypothetical protein